MSDSLLPEKPEKSLGERRLQGQLVHPPAPVEWEEQTRQEEFEPQSIWYYKDVDLRKLFPLSRIYALRKSFSWFLAVAACCGLYYVAKGWNLLPADAPTGKLERYLLAGAGLILLLNLAYHELQRITYVVKITGFRLFISRGILFREKGSLPILPVSEIFIRRSLFDILFGVANLHVATALAKTERFATIEGLPNHAAHALQTFLSDQLSKQVFLAEIPEVDKETGERTPYRRFYSGRKRA